MEKIAEIEHKVTLEKIMNSYYAHYKVKYEEYSKEFYDSLPDSVKEVRVEFYEDRLVIENLIKNEKQTYLYDELYKVQKSENAYLFYTNKVEYRFFEFSDFNAEELENLDNTIKKYYEKTEDNIIAEIERKKKRRLSLSARSKSHKVRVGFVLVEGCCCRNAAALFY